MAKKKQQEIVTEVEEPKIEQKQEEVLVINDGSIQLTGEELYRLLYFDAKIKNLELSRRITARDCDDQMRKIKQTFEKYEQDMATQKETTHKDLAEIRQTIETKYGIKMSECTFDELTGKLTKLL